MRLTGLVFETVRLADLLSAEDASIYVLLRSDYYGEGNTVLVMFSLSQKRDVGEQNCLGRGMIN